MVQKTKGGLMYPTKIKPLGRLMAATNDGIEIEYRKHVYIQKKNKMWREVSNCNGYMV